MLANNITNLLNQSDAIKIKITQAEALLNSQKLSSIKLTKTLTAALQTLEMRHQELKENTSRWELAVSTQCDIDLITAEENPREAIPRKRFPDKEGPSPLVLLVLWGVLLLIVIFLYVCFSYFGVSVCLCIFLNLCICIGKSNDRSRVPP